MSDHSAGKHRFTSDVVFRPGARIAVLVITFVIAIGIVALAAHRFAPVAKSLFSTTTLDQSRGLPDGTLYLIHSTLASAMQAVGVQPSAEAVQWVKAASHAASPDQVAAGGRGIAAARARNGPGGQLDIDLCNTYNYNTPSVQMAISQAGLHCSADPLGRGHVPEGSYIYYNSTPPIGGPHYPVWYPHYGIVDHPVLPGYWVHNLEHGAIVLLYNCPNGCTDVLAQIRALYPTLSPGHNAPSGHPRLLVLPYSPMAHRLAVIAWGHMIEFDELDRARVVEFYDRYLDHGPECWSLTCPP